MVPRVYLGPRNQHNTAMSDNKQQRWVKVPGPGEFRGEGKWIKLDRYTNEPDEVWEEIKDGNWLPIHVGPTPPDQQ